MLHFWHWERMRGSGQVADGGCCRSSKIPGWRCSSKRDGVGVSGAGGGLGEGCLLQGEMWGEDWVLTWGQEKDMPLCRGLTLPGPVLETGA